MTDLQATFTVGVEVDLLEHHRSNTTMRNVTDDVKVRFLDLRLSHRTQ